MEKRKTDQWFYFIILYIFKKQSAPFFIDVWKNVKRLQLNVLITVVVLSFKHGHKSCWYAAAQILHQCICSFGHNCCSGCAERISLQTQTPEEQHQIQLILWGISCTSYRNFTQFPNSAAILSRCTYGIEVGISRQPMIWYYHDTSLMVRYYCHLTFCDMLTVAYIITYTFKLCPQR